jgi:hypothetical protein
MDFVRSHDVYDKAPKLNDCCFQSVSSVFMPNAGDVFSLSGSRCCAISLEVPG